MEKVEAKYHEAQAQMTLACALACRIFGAEEEAERYEKDALALDQESNVGRGAYRNVY